MKIVIKLPNDIKERLLAFPVVQGIYEYYKKYAEEYFLENREEYKFELHLLCQKDNIDILNLLPFEAYYHPLEEEDLKSIFTIHRACVNFKKINTSVDLYFSLTDSFVDASIGKNIGAKQVVGFDVGKNKWFLTKKVLKNNTKHLTESFYDLVNNYLKSADKPPFAKRRVLEPFYIDWQINEYVVIDLDAKDDEINPNWLELFELTTNKNYVFFSSTLDRFQQELMINDFIAKLPKKNNYKFFGYNSNIELAKVAAHSKCFITSNENLFYMGTYFCDLTYYLKREEILERLDTRFLRGQFVEFPILNLENEDSFVALFDQVIDLIEPKNKDLEEEEID